MLMSQPTFKDQVGYNVNIPNFPPQRIVSLVPSQTELLFDLGVGDYVVGLTHFCIHPEDQVKDKTKIGGTKKVKIDLVKELAPDLVIANKEENQKEQVDALKSYFPVWVSDVKGLDSALEMIEAVGELVNEKDAAESLTNKVHKGFQAIPTIDPMKTLYFIWRKPYMAAAGDTFIHDMLSRMGITNALQDYYRYPELSVDDIKRIDPELILLSSEPYPFKEQHIQELKEFAPSAEIRLVDGSMFSWYGSRMLKTVDYCQDLAKVLQKHTSKEDP